MKALSVKRSKNRKIRKMMRSQYRWLSFSSLCFFLAHVLCRADYFGLCCSFLQEGAAEDRQAVSAVVPDAETEEADFQAAADASAAAVHQDHGNPTPGVRPSDYDTQVNINIKKISYIWRKNYHR